MRLTPPDVRAAFLCLNVDNACSMTDAIRWDEKAGLRRDAVYAPKSVSYTHLTLPTNREV